MLEDQYRLQRLELEKEGILRLEVVSADPVVYPITAFYLPDEDRYDAKDSYVITVKVKDGVIQYLFFYILSSEIFKWLLILRQLAHITIKHFVTKRS